MAEKSTQASSGKSGSNKGILVAFIVILLLINGVQLFFNLTQRSTINTQTSTIASNNAKIDSLNVELAKVIKDLELRKQEIAQLGGDTAALGEQIRQLIKDKKSLQASTANWKNKYNEIKDKIDAANQIRDDANKEVERLKLLLAKQDTIITNQKVIIVQREDSISKIVSEKKVLEDKVAIASVLRAESFLIEPLSSKGKVVSGSPVKAKKFEKVRISFNLAENKVADKGGRDIILRIIEPGGAALFDLANGGGSFEQEGKEVFYTMKQNILFENKGQKVSFEYNKGSEYKPGVHNIEVYCDGFKIGVAALAVK